MLDGIEKIPWGSLYGYCDPRRIPGLIRGLVEPGRERYDQTWCDLYNAICHQGTINDTAAYAVPFLIELLSQGSGAFYEEPLGLIAAVATPIPGICDSDARQAARAGINRYIELLCDPYPTVRMAAAHTLACFREHVAVLGPRIRDAVGRDPDTLARAGMMLSLAHLGDGTARSKRLLLSAVNHGADVRENFAAVLALVVLAAPLTWASDEAEFCPIIDSLPRQARGVLQRVAVASHFATACLDGLPWDWTAEEPVDEAIRAVDLPAKSQATIAMLRNALTWANPHVTKWIHADLFALGFSKETLQSFQR